MAASLGVWKPGDVEMAQGELGHGDIDVMPYGRAAPRGEGQIRGDLVGWEWVGPLVKG